MTITPDDFLNVLLGILTVALIGLFGGTLHVFIRLAIRKVKIWRLSKRKSNGFRKWRRTDAETKKSTSS